jgi:hypothetical protein
MTRISKLATVAAAIMVLSLAAPVAAAPAPDASAARAGYSYHPHWRKVHFHMNAYPDAGSGIGGYPYGCHGAWSDASGSCRGIGEYTSVQSSPFEHHVSWQWHRHATHCPDFDGRDHQVWTHELKLVAHHSGWPTEYLCGWVDYHWGTFRITKGEFYTNAGWHTVQTTTSVVADREHTQGGPLFVFLGHRHGGYVLGMRGWLHY